MNGEKVNKKQRDTKPAGPGRLQARSIRGEAKRNPKSIKALLACLQTGTLDGRRREGLQYEAVKEALAQDPAEVAKALLRHDIAVLAVTIRAIVEDAHQGGGFLQDGKLAQALGQDLIRFQAAETQALKALLSIEGNPRSRTAETPAFDVATIVMADNDKENGSC